MRQVKVGVIGCGHIAQEVHIPNYIQNPKSKLEAICDTNQDILKDVEMKYNIKYVFNDYRELLNSGLVEVVRVCVPTSLHSKVVRDAARCGIQTHVQMISERLVKRGFDVEVLTTDPSKKLARAEKYRLSQQN